MPAESILEDAKLDPDMQKEVSCILSCICKAGETCSAEGNHMPTFRFTIKGARQLVAVPLAPLIEYLLRTHRPGGLSMRLVYHSFKSMKAEELNEFLSTSNAAMYQATVGPNDLLYMPSR